jgi:hypothetical protein
VNRRTFFGSAGAGTVQFLAAGQGETQSSRSVRAASGIRLAGMTLSELRKRYHDELFNVFLPFWDEHGIDHENGGFMCSLDYDGTRVNTNKLLVRTPATST